MNVEQFILPLKGSVRAFTDYKNNSYFVIQSAQNYLLLCFEKSAKWHIKLPFSPHHIHCDEHGIYIAGVCYNNAQKVDFHGRIICLSHRGRLLWKYDHPHINEELWAIKPTEEGSLLTCFVKKIEEGYRIRHSCVQEQQIMWSHSTEDIRIQPQFFHPQKIPPALFVSHKHLLSVGAFQFPRANSAIGFLSFEKSNGEKTQFSAPNPNGFYTQSTLSNKGHLAIAWQNYQN